MVETLEKILLLWGPLSLGWVLSIFLGWALWKVTTRHLDSLSKSLLVHKGWKEIVHNLEENNAASHLKLAKALTEIEEELGDLKRNIREQCNV